MTRDLHIDDRQIHAIDATAGRAINVLGLPGMSIAVALKGNVVFAKGYGRRNLGESLNAMPDTVFRIASVSKQFTAAAVLRLRAQGLISLDDPPGKYLSWATYPDGVTVRNFLNHTSGVPCFSTVPEFFLQNWPKEVTPRDVAERVGFDLAFAPGSEWQYSNTTYIVLAALVEELAGKPLHEFLRLEFFEPLNLMRTFGDDSTAILPNVACGYTRFAMGPQERVPETISSWGIGAGSLCSTVLDLVRWNKALRSGEVVSASDFIEMTSPAVLRNGANTGYGLGIGVATLGDGLREVRHDGGTFGFLSCNATYPDIDLDIVFLTNSDAIGYYAHARTILYPILEKLLGQDQITPPAFVPSASLQPVDGDKVRLWIASAFNGTLKNLEPNEALAKFLTTRRADALTKLAYLGAITELSLLEQSRRGTQRILTYRLRFGERNVDVNLRVRDPEQLEEINLFAA